VVFGADFPRIVLPLDTTSTVLVDEKLADRVSELSSPATDFLARLLRLPVSAARFKGKGRPMHDMCAVAYCLWPELFSGRDCHVEVDTSAGINRGRTVIDYWGNRVAPNATVIDTVDNAAFFERFITQLANLV
jgi:purine nucleosidase